LVFPGSPRPRQRPSWPHLPSPGHLLSSCMTCTAASCEGLHPALATGGSQKRVHLWATIRDLAHTYYMHRPRQADTTRPTQRAAAAKLLVHGMHMAAPLRRPSAGGRVRWAAAHAPGAVPGIVHLRAAALFKLACILHDCIDDYAKSTKSRCTVRSASEEATFVASAHI
jgi:hypothetical protein